MGGDYFIRDGYIARLEPEYFVDEHLNAVWQPDLYPEAATLARRLDARKLIDVGCGTAAKLAACHPEFEIVGIDYGSNIEVARAAYPFGTWIETDLDHAESLGYEELDRSILICGDVIEHLVHPERLVAMLRHGLGHGARALLLTTPDRELIGDPERLGPPENPAHVREWTREELASYLEAEGLSPRVGLTRSNDAMPYMRTIIAVVPTDDEKARVVVDTWFDERARWQMLAEEQDRLIAEQQSWIGQLEQAKNWFQEQADGWKAQVDAAMASSSDDDEVPAEAPEPVAPVREEARAYITIVTESDGQEESLRATAESVFAQTLAGWEWFVVGLHASDMEDSRIRAVANPVRAQAIRNVLSQAREYVVYLDPGECLAPTSLEKWLWVLATNPRVDSVTGGSDAVSGLMTRRDVIERHGGLDAAYEHLCQTASRIPYTGGWDTDSIEENETWHDIPPAANAWLEERSPVRNDLPKDKPRLLLISPFMAEGGADRFSLGLLRNLVDSGWDVTVATTLPQPHGLYREYAAITHDLFPMAQFLQLADYPRFLTYLISSRRADVVLVSNSEFGYRMLPYLRSMTSKTVFADFCHSETEDWYHGGYPRLSIEYRDSLDLTMTTSEHLKRWMVERGGEPDRTEVCYVGVDPDSVRPPADGRAGLRRTQGIGEGQFLVSVIGRVASDKQPEVAVGVLGELVRRGVDVRMMVVGDGPKLDWLRVELRRRQLSTYARLTGPIAHDRIGEVLAESDVVFLPSRVEGVSLTFYEAMAAGRPVVGAAVGGQSELVVPETGVLVEPSSVEVQIEAYADALERLAGDRARREAMGRAAKERIELHFRADRCEEHLIETIEAARRAGRRRDTHPEAKGLARAKATEAIELMRMVEIGAAWQASGTWNRRARGDAYYWAQRRWRPAYLWLSSHGLPWLPRLRDAVRRASLGW